MSQSNSPIKRRLSKQIMVGKVPVGGDAPISVQTMTNTRTTDVAATVAQIQAAARAGADREVDCGALERYYLAACSNES